MKLSVALVGVLVSILPSTAPGQDKDGITGRWRLRMEREGWYPRIADGTLDLEKRAEGWRGSIRFEKVLNAQSHPLKDVEVGEASVSFRIDHKEFDITFKAQAKDGRLSGTCAWKDCGNFPWTAKRPSAQDATEAPSRTPARPLPKVEGIDGPALEKLVAAAQEAHSDSLVVWKDGKVVVDETFGSPPGPIEAMSMTKSVVNLAIGHLIGAGKIASLDVPVHTVYPEWNQGRKQQITLRHLLNHTSGLQADAHTREIYASPDFVQLALAAELTSDPGSRFFYNNKAVNLLAGIVQRLSGERLDAYLGKHVFGPLGIRDFSWTTDAAGNPHAMSGLQIQAADLARLGQMLLQDGEWQGRRILPRDWIAESMRPGQPYSLKCGLLWWLISEKDLAVIDDGVIAEWRKANLAEDFIAKVLPLKDRPLEAAEFFKELGKILGGEAGLETWYDNTWRRGLPDGRPVPGPTIGWSANGYLGQWLVVLENRGIVAVRQIRSENHTGPADDLRNFNALVRAL